LVGGLIVDLSPLVIIASMTTSPINQTASFTSLEDNSVFNVVIVYEDFASGQRAKGVLDSIARQQLDVDCEVIHNLWKFDVLRMPRLRKIAANDAAMADLIILALHEDYGVPAHIKAWIESWLPQKPGQAAAMVVLLDAEDELSDCIPFTRACLRDVARRGKMEFFIHTGSSDHTFAIQPSLEHQR
jgi:hypothetical protein